MEFVSMGLFTTDSQWIHPVRTEKTADVIYVISGTVSIYEDDNYYRLKEGDLIVLEKGKQHGGFEVSNGKTSFYWLHVSGTVIRNLFGVVKNYSGSGLFRELMHDANMPVKDKEALRIITEHIFLNIRTEKENTNRNKLAIEVYEWVRINCNYRLKASDVAKNFSYNSEYISKVLKKEFKMGLKEITDYMLCKKIENMLLTTTYSEKEIGAELGFRDLSSFLHYFKYHEKITCTQFKNRFTEIHMNRK